MKIRVYRREATDISYRQIVDLLHDSFQERLEQGLYYTCSFLTEEKYIQKTQEAIIFVAIDEDTKEFVGTNTLMIFSDKNRKKYGYMEYVAISNTCKRSGVGTLLIDSLHKEAESQHCSFVLSDTSTKAESAVRYHLKNGFKIVGLESYRSTNYWSYVFRMQLAPSLLWNNTVFIKLKFLCSFLFIKATRNIDGTDTWIGKLYKKFLGS